MRYRTAFLSYNSAISEANGVIVFPRLLSIYEQSCALIAIPGTEAQIGLGLSGLWANSGIDVTPKVNRRVVIQAPNVFFVKWQRKHWPLSDESVFLVTDLRDVTGEFEVFLTNQDLSKAIYSKWPRALPGQFQITSFSGNSFFAKLSDTTFHDLKTSQYEFYHPGYGVMEMTMLENVAERTGHKFDNDNILGGIKALMEVVYSTKIRAGGSSTGGINFDFDQWEAAIILLLLQLVVSILLYQRATAAKEFLANSDEPSILLSSAGLLAAIRTVYVFAIRGSPLLTIIAVASLFTVHGFGRTSVIVALIFAVGSMTMCVLATRSILRLQKEVGRKEGGNGWLVRMLMFTRRAWMMKRRPPRADT